MMSEIGFAPFFRIRTKKAMTKIVEISAFVYHGATIGLAKSRISVLFEPTKKLSKTSFFLIRRRIHQEFRLCSNREKVVKHDYVEFVVVATCSQP